MRQALGCTPADIGHDERVRIAFAVFDGIGDAGEQIFLDWAAARSKADTAEDRAVWKSARKPGKVRVGTLFGIAKDRGFKFPDGGAATTAPAPSPAEAERMADLKRRQREA
ncbi:MAG: PriCT-2 domain-containing protein, partial [Rubrivivax sp.]|nr:PriCT-2 domain-containing protein [Rubrivivax sp.]